LTVTPRRAGTTVAAALIAALLAVPGCGEDDGGGGGEVTRVGRETAGSVAPLAQCRDWNAGTEEQRLATIEDVRNQLNPEDAPVQTNELSDERAYEVFENGCAPAHAATVRLYQLYARAAAFAPLLEPSQTRAQGP
jgi:hypothetical protein